MLQLALTVLVFCVVILLAPFVALVVLYFFAFVLGVVLLPIAYIFDKVRSKNKIV